MKAIILIAGIGSRLGCPYPKCLNRLPYGETLIERQVRILKECGINEIIGVVGFKKEIIMEHMSSIYYKYNPLYYITNTCKSLLLGIKYINDDVIWINGDVVFEKQIIMEMLKKSTKNKIAVKRKKCYDEEIKYTLTSKGSINKLSKKVIEAEGEAVGINFINKETINKFKEKLSICSDNDYFEKAIELAIDDGIDFYPVDIEENKCIEVDFSIDWKKACDLFVSKRS